MASASWIYSSRRPVINVKLVGASLDFAFATANNLVEQFEQLGLVQEITGRQHNRRFAYSPHFWKTKRRESRRSQNPPPSATRPLFDGMTTTDPAPCERTG